MAELLPIILPALIQAGGQIGSSFIGRNRGGGGGGGGGDFFDFSFLRQLLSNEQEEGLVSNVLGSATDFSGNPLGQLGRGLLTERLQPDFIPRLFRPESLNPFVDAQFRLGREQLERDQIRTDDVFQQLGAAFSPDRVTFKQRLDERNNLGEKDFLANLLFRGGELAENLKTGAAGAAFGLEAQTAQILDALLGRQNQRESTQLGFLSNIAGKGGTTTTGNTGGFLSGLLGTGSGFGNLFGSGGSDIFGALGSLFGGTGGTGSTTSGQLSDMQLFFQNLGRGSFQQGFQP